MAKGDMDYDPMSWIQTETTLGSCMEMEGSQVAQSFLKTRLKWGKWYMMLKFPEIGCWREVITDRQ
jgi:hypothetical protein